MERIELWIGHRPLKKPPQRFYHGVRAKPMNNADQARKHLRIFVACCETEEVV